MFALFFSLYLSMFTGNWNNITISQIGGYTSGPITKVINVLTNIFNNTTTPLTDVTFNPGEILALCALVLALITSIGIVVMAVKGVKKAFGIFFGQIR